MILLASNVSRSNHQSLSTIPIGFMHGMHSMCHPKLRNYACGRPLSARPMRLLQIHEVAQRPISTATPPGANPRQGSRLESILGSAASTELFCFGMSVAAGKYKYGPSRPRYYLPLLKDWLGAWNLACYMDEKNIR